MKKLSLIFSMGLMMFFSIDIIAQVPQQVKDALMQNYPDAEDVEWEEEKDGYEAEFEIDDQEKEALFDRNGNWIETEWDIDDDDLPETVKKTIKRDFHGFEIEDVEGLDSKENGQNLYQVELESDNSEVEILIDAKGDILRRKEMKEVTAEDLVDEIEDIVD